jgi:hypothetical protein
MDLPPDLDLPRPDLPADLPPLPAVDILRKLIRVERMERMMDELSLVEGKTISNAGSGILGNNLGNVCLKGGKGVYFWKLIFGVRILAIWGKSLSGEIITIISAVYINNSCVQSGGSHSNG